MKTIITFFVALFFFTANAQSEAPGILWNTSISSGAATNFNGYQVHQYSDGNYLLTGRKDDILQLTKTSSSGAVIWQKIFTELVTYSEHDALDNAGNLLVVSQPASNQSSVFAKIDSNGNLLWTKDLVISDIPSSNLYAIDIKPFSDGNFVIAGNFENGTQMGYFISKYDSNGNNIWTKKQVYNTLPASGFSEIKILNDGNFAILGVTTDGTKVFSWISKFDSLGNPVWNQPIDLNGSSDTYADDVLVTASGDFIAATDYITASNQVKISLSKYSAAGNFVWQKNITVQGTDFNNLKIIEFSPNDVTLGYSLPSPGTGVFMKILSNGDVAWEHLYSGAPLDGYFSDYIKANDGNLMLLSEYFNNRSYLLYKMGGSLSVTNIDKESIKIYPNPVKDMLHFSEEVSAIRINDASGRTVKNHTVNGKSVNMANLPKGVYMMSFTNNKGETITRKIIKE